MKRLSVGGVLIGLGVALWALIGGLVWHEARTQPAVPTSAPRVMYLTPTPLPATTTPLATATDRASHSPIPPTNAPVAASVTMDTLPVVAAPATSSMEVGSTVIAMAAPATESATISTPSSPSVSVAPTVIVLPNGCKPPEGWVAYTIEEGDTLFGFQLGSNNTIDVKTIREANCLTGNLLSIGQVIFLPPGIAEQSPKVDEGSSGNPNGITRRGTCPCTIIVREGWRLEQIAAAVDSSGASFTGQDFLAATSANASVPAEFGFLSSRPTGKTLEGFMFPGSYALTNETSAAAFRDMLLSAFSNAVTPDLQAALTSHGLSLWEAINMASIVQREARDPNEQKMVTSIFYNRRAKGMALGTFVTLQYALGRPGAWWPRITKTTINTETPYAMHRYRGLPPTPIDSPGLTAIIAVAYPNQTDYLYMNAKCGGGGNFYARTFEEFQQGLKCE